MLGTNACNHMCQPIAIMISPVLDEVTMCKGVTRCLLSLCSPARPGAPAAGERGDGAGQPGLAGLCCGKQCPQLALSPSSSLQLTPCLCSPLKIISLLINRLHLATCFKSTHNPATFSAGNYNVFERHPKKSRCTLKERFRASHLVISSENELPPAPGGS